jgi:hypothetical protein
MSRHCSRRFRWRRHGKRSIYGVEISGLEKGKEGTQLSMGTSGTLFLSEFSH